MTRERAVDPQAVAESGVMQAEHAADMPRIETAEQYREAVEEMQRLQAAREGSPEFERRQALQAALADYELRRIPDRPPGVG
jgi:hypothetical protein